MIEAALNETPAEPTPFVGADLARGWPRREAPAAAGGEDGAR